MEIIQFENCPVYKLTKRKFLWNKSKVRLVAVQRFNLVGEISVWSLPNLVTTWFSISVILPKSMLGQNGDGLSTLSLTVVHFSPKPDADLCMRVDLPLDKKTVENQVAGPSRAAGPRTAGPSGRKAVAGRWVAGRLLAKPLPVWFDSINCFRWLCGRIYF